MRRSFFSLVVAGLAIAATTSLAQALVIAMKPPTQRALSAQVVVVGKVTAIEKETVEAAPFHNAPNKLHYKVAVVRVETRLAGANDLTHIKIGFIPPPPQAAPPPIQPGVIRPAIKRRPNLLPELKEGQEMIFFLSKHPDAGFFVMSNMSPPLDMKAEGTKKEIESIKKVLAVAADPMKGLQSEKADDRAFAATVLASKYRAYPDTGGEVEQVPISAEENKLILKGLAEADWTKVDRSMPSPVQAFYSLGLTDKDDWVPPKAVPAKPGQAPVNYNALVKEAFVKWQDGPGKVYQIKRIVPKKK
ncbi:MAG TPA: hypothetical protein VGL71_08765 [Urbifossiella sp.]|jgi:hypothetical protein